MEKTEKTLKKLTHMWNHAVCDQPHDHQVKLPHPTHVNFTSLTEVFRHVKTKIIFLITSKQDLNEIVSDRAINFFQQWLRHCATIQKRVD